jgi:hypothetical protein
MKSKFSLNAEFSAQIYACFFSAAVGFLLALIIELFKVIV